MKRAILTILCALLLVTLFTNYPYFWAIWVNTFTPYHKVLYTASCSNGGFILVESNGRAYGSNIMAIDGIGSGIAKWINLSYIGPTGNRVPFQSSDNPISFETYKGFTLNAALASKTPSYIPPGQSFLVSMEHPPENGRLVNLHISHLLVDLPEYTTIQTCFKDNDGKILSIIFDSNEPIDSGWHAQGVTMLYYDKDVRY